MVGSSLGHRHLLRCGAQRSDRSRRQVVQPNVRGARRAGARKGGRQAVKAHAIAAPHPFLVSQKEPGHSCTRCT